MILVFPLYWHDVCCKPLVLLAFCSQRKACSGVEMVLDCKEKYFLRHGSLKLDALLCTAHKPF